MKVPPWPLDLGEYLAHRHGGVSCESEPAALEETPCDVMGERSEAEGGAAKVVKAPVYCFGWTVGGAGIAASGRGARHR